jgi:hypothetical protein
MTNKNVLPSRSGSLPEVPWVMGDPHASYKWQVSVAGKGKKKGKEGRAKPEKLENIVLKLTLRVKKSYLEGNFITRLFGGSIKEDFNPIIVAETLLRALHHAKFKSIEKISADGEELYNAKNKEEDIKEIIQILKDEEFEGTLFKQVKISAEHRTNLAAEIEIRRVHSRRKFPITISLNGKIKRENLERLMSYIKKHLPLEELRY